MKQSDQLPLLLRNTMKYRTKKCVRQTTATPLMKAIRQKWEISKLMAHAAKQPKEFRRAVHAKNDNTLYTLCALEENY